MFHERIGKYKDKLAIRQEKFIILSALSQNGFKNWVIALKQHLIITMTQFAAWLVSRAYTVRLINSPSYPAEYLKNYQSYLPRISI